ncbi:hypothetical protein P171DRAFT_490946 [Karstenula rhodostoma CBS 690.94]|uniref:Uncharacterized protein n=1 Tax=Karstenula rhodostoma CBS 690.94 TaxID=1392251 RepID=A0A9P4P5S9_9PLEO|nr:hypothetical protein P171DRAFT_490946 [Karstenula rhodostoma CBS 690.94]
MTAGWVLVYGERGAIKWHICPSPPNVLECDELNCFDFIRHGSSPCTIFRCRYNRRHLYPALKPAVFILDEVQMRRLSGGGLAALEGLEPDITTLRKWVGGGVAFGGRGEIMRIPRDGNALAPSGTFNNNNTLAMLAGYNGLSQIYTPSVAHAFNAIGDKLRSALPELRQINVTGRGTVMGIHFLEDGKKDVKSYKDRNDEV